MRYARAQDYYRRIREKPQRWPVRVAGVSFKGIPGIGEGDIPISSVLTVLCGPNGVGKTTLLRAVWAALDPKAAAQKVITARKLAAGAASIDIGTADQTTRCVATFVDGAVEADGANEVEIVHIDSSVEVLQQQEVFCAYDNAEDIINGAGPRVLEDKDLTELKYIAKRDYRSVAVYEVEFVDKVLPFFEIMFGSDRYDSRTMGTGELAAFYLWWALDRAPIGSIVLIEEPESYLSPGSQEAFRDFLVGVMYERKLCVIMTSHSSPIISSLSKECVRFFRRDPGGIKLISDRPPPILLETVGIKPRVDTLVFVEDQAAATFCRLWLERFDPNLSRRIEIAVRNGEGEIINTARQLSGNYKFLRFVALFDGDQKGKTPEDIGSLTAYLPGDEPIEQLFRTLVIGDPAKVVDAIGCNDLSTILFGLEGADHHDWYEKLCEHIGLNKPQLFVVLFNIWMKHEQNIAAANLRYNELLRLIDPSSATGAIAAEMPVQPMETAPGAVSGTPA